MIKGGQGRTPEELISTAMLLIWVAVGAVLWVAILATLSLLQ
jgi:hypothetical protein